MNNSSVLAPGNEVASLFTGRAVELQRLSEQWGLALTGKTLGVTISGDPGIGKSSLVSHWLASLSAASGNALIVSERCMPATGQPLCATMMDIVNALCRQDASGQTYSLLVRFAPSWSVCMPWLQPFARENDDIPTTSPLSPCPAFSELCAFLEALTLERPTIIVLDDAHWCDKETVELLNYLCARQTQSRLLLICIGCRWGDAGTSVEQPASTFSLFEEDWQQIELGPLDNDALDRMLSERPACWNRDYSLKQCVDNGSAAHPLYLTGIVAQLNCGETPGHATTQIPEEFKRRMERELRQLSFDDQKLLQSASVVVVSAFSAAAVAHLLGLDLADTEERLDYLASRTHWLVRLEGRLWPDGTYAQSYCFGQTLYRDFIYQTLSIACRQLMHRRHGCRLETGYADKVTRIVENLTYHFEQGGDVERASYYRQLEHCAILDNSPIASVDLTPCPHSPALH